MKLHNFYGGFWDLQVRVTFERFCHRFVRLRLHDRMRQPTEDSSVCVTRATDAREAASRPLFWGRP